MPLQENDIVVDQIANVPMTTSQGRQVRGLQYSFTVRGQGPFFMTMQEDNFDVNTAYQNIMRIAADQIEILERFALRG
jgi:hypothetical protein